MTRTPAEMASLAYQRTQRVVMYGVLERALQVVARLDHSGAGPVDNDTALLLDTAATALGDILDRTPAPVPVKWEGLQVPPFDFDKTATRIRGGIRAACRYAMWLRSEEPAILDPADGRWKVEHMDWLLVAVDQLKRLALIYGYPPEPGTGPGAGPGHLPGSGRGADRG